MTPSEERFWRSMNARAARLSPELATALLSAFDRLREQIDLPQIKDAITRGDVDGLIAIALGDAVVIAAFRVLRSRLRSGVEQATISYTSRIPVAAARELSVAFDVLNPRVIDALRTLESTSIDTIPAMLRETAREVISRGLTDGDSIATIAAELRDTLGLPPNMAAAVANFRRMLEAGDVEALTRELRDHRFDSTIRRLFANGDAPTAEQIDRWVGAYRDRAIANNAEVLTRAVARDAQKVGQQLSWQDAADNGALGDAVVLKQWHHLPGQLDPRPEHEDMDGVEVPMDENYPNGDSYPGEGDPWGCHCWETYRVQPASERVATT